MRKNTILFKLLREPLFHFLVIGAGIFLLFNQVNSNSGNEISDRIIITQADLNSLAASWLKSKGRPPTAQEREQQLKFFIREQVLYREAMALGLDKDDVIVRRRLAKKMQYLFNDLTFIEEPTEAELNSYLSDHASFFRQPATITFSQIFLDPDEHGQAILKDSQQLLEQLQLLPANEDTLELGDRSLLPYEFTNERQGDIASMFGNEFSQKIFSAPLNESTGSGWFGPVKSGYGVHLVNIHSRKKARLPEISEIRDRVIREWRNMKQRKANEVFYQSLYQRYEIVLADDIAEDVISDIKQ